MSDRWRGIVAALLNPELRAALAEVMPDSGLSDQRRTRAMSRLEQVGLVRRDKDGVVVFDESTLRSILGEETPVRRMGVQRFLRADGRIDRYPANAADRIELLRWVAEHTLRPEEVLTERQINERLETFTSDVAVLRRYLVDAGLVERTRSGSQYVLVASDG